MDRDSLCAPAAATSLPRLSAPRPVHLSWIGPEERTSESATRERERELLPMLLLLLHPGLHPALPPGGAIGTNVTAVELFLCRAQHECTQVNKTKLPRTRIFLCFAHKYAADLACEGAQAQILRVFESILAFLCGAGESLPGGPNKATHLCQGLHVLFILLSLSFLSARASYLERSVEVRAV